MVNFLKNMFKNNNKERAVETAPVQSEGTQAQADSDNVTVPEKKSKHGEDGVCCGGCS